MKTFAIILPTLVANDAIGNDVLFEYELLREKGYKVLLFAENREPAFEKYMCNLIDLKYADIIIYHHGIHWELGEEILRNHKGNRKILKYHNVTPKEFFQDYDSVITSIVETGRKQTYDLVKLCTHYFSDSLYNQMELVELGADITKCKVVAPFHRVDDILKAEADVTKINLLLSLKRPIILFVGRQAPNKGMLHFVKVAKAYVDYFDRNVLFIWAGGKDDRFQKYYDEVQDFIVNNNLKDIVSFPGKLSLSELKSYFICSQLFLIMSEHEGFCVPVIEVQCLGIPLVALKRSAVGETAGEEQLLFDDMEYDRIATAIGILLNNNEYSLYLSEKGKQNIELKFNRLTMEDTFLAAIEEVI